MWKEVDGYDGNYVVNELGEVKSFKRDILNGILMEPHLNKRGYMVVGLTKRNGKRKTVFVHRLIAQAFIDNPHNKKEVNHIDECKSNNNVINLEWVTAKENSNHGTRIQRVVNAIDYKTVARKNSVPLIQLDLNGCVVRKWDSGAECARVTNFDYSAIFRCCKGERKTAYGFKWRYA
ncbi:MAG: NUMOD4 domain-containing protein [Solibacillus sp.]